MSQSAQDGSNSSSVIHSMKIQDEVATTCTVASLLISCYQIAMHLVHYNEPHIQLYILRILMMIPVYSTMTWLSIMMPKEALYYNTIRDIYEAYVLYIFMQLLIHFLGGENSLIVHLEFKRRIKQPWPLNDLKPLQTDKIFFRRVKQGVLQFVLIKPITAVLSIIFEHYGIYHEGHFEWYSGYMYLSGINNTSVSLSLYCLVLFYLATEERLKPFSPFAKFLCIKAILFFSFWQACAFTVLQKMNLFDHETAGLAQSLTISIEMVFAAVAQAFAFNYRPFLEGGVHYGRNGGNNNHQDNKNSVQNHLQSSSSDNNNNSALRATTSMIKNMTYVLNVKDVISDAHNTFMRGDDEKDSEQEMQLEDILRRDKAFNWSDEDIKSITENENDNKDDSRDLERNHSFISSKHSKAALKNNKKATQNLSKNNRSSLNSIHSSNSHFKHLPLNDVNKPFVITRHSHPLIIQKPPQSSSIITQHAYKQVRYIEEEDDDQVKQHNQDDEQEEGNYNNVFEISHNDEEYQQYDSEEEEEEEEEEDDVKISFDNNKVSKASFTPIKVASNLGSQPKIVIKQQPQQQQHQSFRKPKSQQQQQQQQMQTIIQI